MDVFEAINCRRSVRNFTIEPITDEEVKKIIEAAKSAPSAGNIQPWEFIVIRETKVKLRLSEAALNQNFIKEAPVFIVVCADKALSARGYGSRGVNLYCLQDTAAAIQNMLLAAYALGLATCWVGAFQEEEVRGVLNTPRSVRPVAIIPVGHPAEKNAAPSRRPLSDLVHYETFK